MPASRYFWIVCVGYAVDLGSYVGMVEAGMHLYLAHLIDLGDITQLNEWAAVLGIRHRSFLTYSLSTARTGPASAPARTG